MWLNTWHVDDNMVVHVAMLWLFPKIVCPCEDSWKFVHKGDIGTVMDIFDDHNIREINLEYEQWSCWYWCGLWRHADVGMDNGDNADKDAGDVSDEVMLIE